MFERFFTWDRLKKTWPDWLNATVGAWMIFSAFVPLLAGHPPGPIASGLSGLAILAVSLAAVERITPWKEWINLGLGLWLVGAPFALNIHDFNPFWNFVGDGAFLFFHAGYQLVSPPLRRRLF